MKKSVILEKAIVYHKVRNETGTSSAQAPYLGQIELAGVVPQETFVEEMIEDGCSATAATVNLVLNARNSVLGECVGAKGYKVHTSEALVMPHLSGSLPAPDANPGEGNELVPRIDLGDELRLAASDIVPKENREEVSDLGGVRILSVFTEGVGFTQLKGTLPFSIAGVGFKPSASSSTAVKVVSAKTGDETAADDVTVVDNQHITAQLGEALAKGDYKVVVTVTDESAAGNRDASYNVKMLAAPQPPGPAPIATNSDGTVKCMSVEDPESPGLPVLGDDWTIGFEGLADNAKWRYDSTSFKVGGETKDSRATCDGDTLTFCGVEGVSETGDYDGVITVTLVDKDDEETTDTVDIPVHFHAEEH